MLGCLIGRVMIEIGIEIIDNEGLIAIWPTQMPFSPAPREFRSELASKGSVYIEEKGRKLDSLSLDAFFSAAVETLISYGLEYMLMMCL